MIVYFEYDTINSKYNNIKLVKNPLIFCADHHMDYDVF